MITAAEFNEFGRGALPGYLGIEITRVDGREIQARLPIRPELMAPNGYLHAGSVVTLADSLCGYGCLNNLPDGASGFTTIELKSNHLGTARDGSIECTARAAHLGRQTQVWDATVTHAGTDRVLALFRCTQMVLYPRAG
jgi:uncharacterized protein (TIGR00369 family)